MSTERYRISTELLPNVYRTVTKQLPNFYRIVTEFLPNSYRMSYEQLSITCRTVTDFLPNSCRISTEQLPNFYRTVTEFLPNTYWMYTELLPNSCWTVTECLPNSHRNVTECLPNCYRIVAQLLPNVYRTVTIISLSQDYVFSLLHPTIIAFSYLRIANYCANHRNIEWLAKFVTYITCCKLKVMLPGKLIIAIESGHSAHYCDDNNRKLNFHGYNLFRLYKRQHGFLIARYNKSDGEKVLV